VARLARAHADIERPWVPVAGELEIEDWKLARAEPATQEPAKEDAS
jgi:hypothetical protein